MSKLIEITIPIRAVSSNQPYAGVHWATRQKWVNEFKQSVRVALPDALVQGDGWPVQRVDFCVDAYFASRPQDSDNIGFATKMIIDALKGWVMPDDDISHVRRVCMESHSGPRNEIIVTATEVKPPAR